MKRILIAVGVLALIGLIAFRLVSNKKAIEKDKQATTQFQTTPVVQVQPATYQKVDQTMALLGTVAARNEGKIIAEKGGKLQNFQLQLGSYVRRGQQVGFVQDPVQQVTIQNNQTNVDNARREMERYERLYKGGAVTQEAYQKFKDQYESTLIGLKQQKQVLGNGAVIVPISGTVFDKKVQNGEFVTPGTVLASVIDMSQLKLVVNVPEQAVYQLKIGDKANITSQAYPGVTFTGTVHYISPKGDDLHNYPVELYIVNNAKNPLKAGTFASANFRFKNGINGLFIPRRALVGGADSASVYVVEQNKAHLRRIKLGQDNGDQYQVLSGLQAGENVVINGQLNLSDGVTVSVSNGSAPSTTLADSSTQAVAVKP